ncbi:MAG: hypothetical protein K8R69_03280, partial [Deltaproteobacteria bacterium]|nr:hypothetical protein [Deltaproteobacteria bacterium]
MVLRPDIPGSTVATPGPLPASSDAPVTGGPVSAPITTGSPAPTPPPHDGAGAASDLHATEARREDTPTTSARDVYRARIDRLRERIRDLPTLPDARASTTLTEVLAEARSLETSGDTNFVVDDLIAVRGCYRYLSRRAAESTFLRGHPEYASIATGLTRVEGTMRAARDIFRGAATGATGNCTPRERMHMSRLAIRLSRDLLETTFESSDLNHEASELITDYRNEMHLLRGVGSEDLPDRDRADRIARDLSETFDLRTRLRTDTHIVRIEDHDIALVTNAAEQNLQAVDSLMLGFGTDLHNSVGFIESRNAHAAIDRLIHGIIEGNQESLVPRLNAAGLEEYCRLSAAAEESVERASGLTDPAARRTALAEALQGFVSLGDTSRVGEVVDLMVASLPADASDTLRLQVFTAMGSILHGSGMNAETRIRELADPIARRLAATETPEVYHREIEADEYTGPGGRSGATVVSTTLVNERGYLNTAAAIMAARSYYSAVGDTEAARGSETRLTDLRSQIDSQLNRTSGSRLRIELSASSVEIDMALEGSASAEHLGAWRTAIRSASDLPADERLTQLRSLLRVATLTRREAESGGTERTDLAEINTWATDVIGTIAEDRIRQLTTDHHVDTEFSASVISDFRTRLGRAVTEGDTAWIGGVSERAIDQFADLAQSGHVLLSGRHTPPTTRDLRSCLQAAAIFSRLGSTGRVTEAMAPLLTHAEGIENTTERANFYLSLGQVYQEAGMSVDANQILDRVAALDVTGAPRELHRIAEIVPAMRELNLGHLDRARELLTGIRGNPRAEEMLGNVEGAIRRSRSLQTLDALRILASDYIARERAHGSSRADASDREIRSALDEAQRLIVSGRFTTVEAALSHLHGESFGLSDMIRDSAGTGPIDGLFRASADVTMSSDRFSENMLAFASGLADGEYYSAASQIGNLLTRNPHTSAAARTLVDGIPGAARLSGILTEIGNMSIIFAESDSAALRSGVITIATFGLGRVAAAGAELAFASYATESAIASSMALRATGFVVRSTAEATTFTLSNMAFETLFTGRTDHWSLDNFGHQFGAMMVTFMFCHGIGMATTGLGRAAARTSLLGEVAADGSRTLSLTGRVAMGAVGYGATITGLTGVEYINEGLGLHPPGGNVPFLTRLLGSAVMDAQMRLAGRVFNEATGGAVERWEAGTRERYAIHELLPAIERLGFGRPNAEGELSGEGTTVLRAMLARVARGESASEVAASVSAETSGDLTRITQTVLGVEPNSADGRRLQALLFAYRAAHPDANLAEVAGRLQIESNRLARAAGLTEGPEYEIVRAELFRRSLASSSTVEAVTGNSAAFAELRPGLEGVANDLLGSGGSSSLEGQRLIGRLLLRSLDSSGGLRVERAATERIREQVRGMGLDPDSSAGRRMSADLLL